MNIQRELTPEELVKCTKLTSYFITDKTPPIGAKWAVCVADFRTQKPRRGCADKLQIGYAYPPVESNGTYHFRVVISGSPIKTARFELSKEEFDKHFRVL